MEIKVQRIKEIEKYLPKSPGFRIMLISGLLVSVSALSLGGITLFFIITGMFSIFGIVIGALMAMDGE